MCALLAIFFTSAANSFKKTVKNGSSCLLSAHEWLKKWNLSLKNGMEAVEKYGRVKPGLRSIIDPLNAISIYLSEQIDILPMNESSSPIELEQLIKKLVDIAYEASSLTASMRPMVGRASYVDPSLIKDPDAGATAISIIMSSIYKAIIICKNQQN